MPPMYPDQYPSLILRLGDLEIAISRIVSDGYNRARQQGAEVGYSYSGTPLIKGNSHQAKYLWTVSAYVDYQELKIIKAMAEKSDLLMHSPPYDGYEITLSDIVTPVSEPTQIRGKASYFLDDETLGCVCYFAQFKVVIPLQSIEEESAGAWFKISFQMFETTLAEEDAPSEQLEPPIGGNPPTSGGFNVPILLSQLPSQVITTNNYSDSVNWGTLQGKPSTFPSSWSQVSSKPSTFPSSWSEIASKPSTFPSSWSEISGKPSTFPTSWSQVSSIPDLAYQSELDAVYNALTASIGSVSANQANYLPLVGGTLSGSLHLANVANALTGANWTAFKLGNEAVHTNNYLGVTQISTTDLATAPFVRNPLVISHHSGISFSSFSGYGGTRFYSASPTDPFNYDGNLIAVFNYPRSYFGVPLAIGGGTPNAFSFEVNGDTYAMGYTRISNNGIYAQSMDAYIIPVGMSYGSWVIRGSGGGVGGWNGLSFPTGVDQAVDLSLMMGNVVHGPGGCQVGVYDTSLGWYFYTIGQTMYAGAYANISDATLKEEIQPMGSALEVIKSLNPVSFKWKEGKGDEHKHNGFLAQQLESNPKLSHLVRRNSQTLTKDGKGTDEKLSIVFSELIPYLVKAAQEIDFKLSDYSRAADNKANQLQTQLATIQANISNMSAQLTSVQTLAQNNSQRLDKLPNK